MRRLPVIALFAVAAFATTAAPAAAQNAPAPGAQADAYWDRDAQARARAALYKEHGGGTNYFLLATS